MKSNSTGRTVTNEEATYRYGRSAQADQTPEGQNGVPFLGPRVFVEGMTMSDDASSAVHCYAFRERGGEIDLDSISETPDNVRVKYLSSSMGWRLQYPDRYSQDEEWQRVLTFGSVVPVLVSSAETE